MRVFATSDLHVDYAVNADWVASLSRHDHRRDALIVAGDISDSLVQLGRCLEQFSERFRIVLYVPGNHDLWVIRNDMIDNSVKKFDEVTRVAVESGATIKEWRSEGLRIVPLLGWYDFSFGKPSAELRSIWADFYACRWPDGLREADITAEFLRRNMPITADPTQTTLSFSHFLPRIEVMPSLIPSSRQMLYPVLGARGLDEQIRTLGARLHVYGHSHVNRRVELEGVTYVNNAYGYPHEGRISAKRLLCVYNT